MRITDQRFLRGPNMYAASPCLLAVIDTDKASGSLPAMVPGLGSRLLALLPEMPPAASARLSDCQSPLDALEPLVMELQRLAGAAGPFSRTIADPARPGTARVVWGYVTEQVAGAALRVARQLIGALARDEDYDLAAALEELRDTARHYAIGTSTAAVLAAAHKRGIPSMRLTDEANLFQLGWGSRQKRLQATITGATNHIAVGIASDKQLTKALLDQAGCPVPAGETVTTLAQAQRVARRIVSSSGGSG